MNLRDLEALGLRVRRDGGGLVVAPSDLLTPELVAKIKAAKPAILKELARHELPLLTAEERATLDRLARAWGMDEHERAVMYRQCEHGADLADGSWLSPEEARAFWLAEAGAIH